MSQQRIRRLALAGDFADLDWTDPTIAAPQNARRFKVTDDRIMFDIVARASTNTDATEVDVGTMVADAWVGYFGRPGNPADPLGSIGTTIRRGQSVLEATSSTLSTRIRLEATGAEVGSVAVLNMTLTSVGGLTAVDVELVCGARPL